ncbi:MAG: ferrous iron transport protein A [Clostridia bacterium]|nr:ferrous iron transport protein A [Clostridia bacterium]MBQ6959534.1 ferrous iron transport protein A [Clostridia bacterium]
MRDLSTLPLGRSGRVLCLRAGEGMGRRLMDLGFTPGARASCVLAAPGDGMRAYRVRGAVIALRRREARTVILEGDNHE